MIIRNDTMDFDTDLIGHVVRNEDRSVTVWLETKSVVDNEVLISFYAQRFEGVSAEQVWTQIHEHATFIEEK